jgi:N-alpha-acetyltransferase 30
MSAEDQCVIEYCDYTDESMLADIQSLVSKDLSEPYSIFTFRYFLHNWPRLCVCAYAVDEATGRREMIGTIVCKVEVDRESNKGYVAMLAVNKDYRKRGIGSKLVSIGLDRMVSMGCDEITLEAEVS